MLGVSSKKMPCIDNGLLGETWSLILTCGVEFAGEFEAPFPANAEADPKYSRPRAAFPPCGDARGEGDGEGDFDLSRLNGDLSRMACKLLRCHGLAFGRGFRLPFCVASPSSAPLALPLT